MDTVKVVALNEEVAGQRAMEKNHHAEELFLQTLCAEKTAVAVYLVNGIKLLGNIQAFDALSVLLNNGNKQLIYKHAISTISPTRD